MQRLIIAYLTLHEYNYHADTVKLIEMDVGDSAAIAARTLGYETLKRSPKECYIVLKSVNGNDVLLYLPQAMRGRAYVLLVYLWF